MSHDDNNEACALNDPAVLMPPATRGLGCSCPPEQQAQPTVDLSDLTTGQREERALRELRRALENTYLSTLAIVRMVVAVALRDGRATPRRLAATVELAMAEVEERREKRAVRGLRS